MPDAFTYTRGNEQRTFKSRAELYDYMIEQGEVILEGDDAVKFKAHCEKRKQSNPKAVSALSRIDVESV